MHISLILACLWALGANLLVVATSSTHHRRATFALIAVGIPILGYVTWQNGPLLGFLCLMAAMSMLRWPVVYLWRSVRGTETGVEGKVSR